MGYPRVWSGWGTGNAVRAWVANRDMNASFALPSGIDAVLRCWNTGVSASVSRGYPTANREMTSRFATPLEEFPGHNSPSGEGVARGLRPPSAPAGSHCRIGQKASRARLSTAGKRGRTPLSRSRPVPADRAPRTLEIPPRGGLPDTGQWRLGSATCDWPNPVRMDLEMRVYVACYAVGRLDGVGQGRPSGGLDFSHATSKKGPSVAPAWTLSARDRTSHPRCRRRSLPRDDGPHFLATRTKPVV